MEKKIASLKAAYAAKDGVKLHKAACAVVAYDRAHPFAALCNGFKAAETIALAKKIAELPGTVAF